MKYLILNICLSFILFYTSIVNAKDDIKHFARFEYQQKISYGEINGEFIQPLSGDLYNELTPVDKPLPYQMFHYYYQPNQKKSLLSE